MAAPATSQSPATEAEHRRALSVLTRRAPFDAVPERILERFIERSDVVKHRPGVEIVHQGDFGAAMYVVLAGSVVVRVRRPSGEETVVAILRRGDVFGELSVLGERPYTATVVVNEPAILLVSQRETLGRLLKASPELLRHFDTLYRRRAISANFMVDPIFSELDPGLLEELIQASRMRALEREEVVVREGDPGEAFYIVWTGHLRASVTVDGDERIFSYLQAGDYFGEISLVLDVPRTATVTANEPSQVIEVQRADFQRLLASDPVLLERMTEGVAQRRQMVARFDRPEVQDFMEQMLASGATHATGALLINLQTCVRCGNCAAACHHRYGNSRLLRRGKEFVLPDTQAHVLMPSSCWHCRDPECMIGCPTDALRRQATGEIEILEDRCIGCEICANQCPWGNISMAGVDSKGGALARLGGLIREGVRLLRRAAAEAEPARKARAKAVKCDLCRGVDGRPACIAACPYDAIDLVDPGAYLRHALEA